MKANYFAMLASLCVVALPLHADKIPSKPKPVIQTSSSRSKIDLNKADLATLIGSFKGIGKKRAEAILAYRESHSGFKSLEELAEIKGFGQHFIDNNKEQLNEVFSIN